MYYREPGDQETQSMITIIPFYFGCIVVISIVICKYYHRPDILLLSIILTSYVYQIVTNRKSNQVYNFDEALINVSQFIIISGITGYLVVTIISYLLSGFD